MSGARHADPLVAWTSVGPRSVVRAPAVALCDCGRLNPNPCPLCDAKHCPTQPYHEHPAVRSVLAARRHANGNAAANGSYVDAVACTHGHTGTWQGQRMRAVPSLLSCAAHLQCEIRGASKGV